MFISINIYGTVFFININIYGIIFIGVSIYGTIFININVYGKNLSVSIYTVQYYQYQYIR